MRAVPSHDHHRGETRKMLSWPGARAGLTALPVLAGAGQQMASQLAEQLPARVVWQVVPGPLRTGPAFKFARPLTSLTATAWILRLRHAAGSIQVETERWLSPFSSLGYIHNVEQSIARPLPLDQATARPGPGTTRAGWLLSHCARPATVPGQLEQPSNQLTYS
jgi:hypothetical protein